jgi:multisubunit Na+/H+ antiporter MnhB subunit
MNRGNHVSNAKAIIALLIFAIAFVIFYKFMTNQNYFFQDPTALRNYIMFAIVGGGFLIGLLYLTSNTTHNAPSKTKTVKSSKSKKKKK